MRRAEGGGFQRLEEEEAEEAEEGRRDNPRRYVSSATGAGVVL